MEQKDIEKFQAEAQACAEPLGRIKIEMGRVIAGQDQLIDRLLLAQQQLEAKGVLEGRIHRFLLIAEKPRAGHRGI